MIIGALRNSAGRTHLGKFISCNILQPSSFTVAATRLVSVSPAACISDEDDSDLIGFDIVVESGRPAFPKRWHASITVHAIAAKAFALSNIEH